MQRVSEEVFGIVSCTIFGDLCALVNHWFDYGLHLAQQFAKQVTIGPILTLTANEAIFLRPVELNVFESRWKENIDI